MADKKWNELGEEIRDAVNGAVNSGDFSGLSKSIGELVNSAVDSAADAVNKAVEKSQNQQGVRNQEYQQTSWQQESRQNARQQAAPHQEYRQAARTGTYSSGSSTAPALYVKKPQGMGGSIAIMVLGYCLLVVGLIALLLSVVLSMVSSLFIIAVILFLVMAGGGLWLAISGTMQFSFLNRFRSYTRQIGWQLCVPIQTIAQKCNRPVPAVTKDLQKMIERHLFYEAHLDAGEGFLLLTDKAYEEYQKTKEQSYQKQKEMEREQELKKQMQREDAQLSEECRRMIETGESYVSYVRSCNDAIPGEEFSAKLDKMEHLIGRIFEELRKNAETASELEKMMDYYLPTTAKLLGAYCELDAQPGNGENVSRTKKEIEDAIDTLNAAFEKLLDSLFEERAWDISSDISVLHTMLAQEGLTKNDFGKENI